MAKMVKTVNKGTIETFFKGLKDGWNEGAAKGLLLKIRLIRSFQRFPRYREVEAQLLRGLDELERYANGEKAGIGKMERETAAFNLAMDCCAWSQRCSDARSEVCVFCTIMNCQKMRAIQACMLCGTSKIMWAV